MTAPVLPTREGHEYTTEPAGLRVCWLCGAVEGGVGSGESCTGSAAEPGSIA